MPRPKRTNGAVRQAAGGSRGIPSLRARLLFDRMPRRKRAKGAVQRAGGSRRGIESLPDELIQHILGFLQAEEAVRTSVLARRWRHLWKSATGLRVGRCEPDLQLPVEGLRSLVNHLLLHRGGSPLEECHFAFDDRLTSHDDGSHVNLWFWHVVKCQVHVLSLYMFGPRRAGKFWVELDDLQLISRRLRYLDLAGVQVRNSLLDFSNCPALEFLQLLGCEMSSVKEIVSESLKHLIICLATVSCDSRIHICTPNVASLRLWNFEGRTPILEGMPSLLQASVEITGDCRDYCTDADYFWTCDCESCDTSDSTTSGSISDCESCGSSDDTADGSINCVLLRGLSEAKRLSLKSASNMFIFKRDLRWCPVFTNLKTLLLNDYWYVPDDFHALACILEHSPVLEKLTFELHDEWGVDFLHKHKVEIKLCVSSMKRSTAISEHLKIVEIKCEVVDDRVLKIMKFLCSLNICFRIDEMETLE